MTTLETGDPDVVRLEVLIEALDECEPDEEAALLQAIRTGMAGLANVPLELRRRLLDFQSRRRGMPR